MTIIILIEKYMINDIEAKLMLFLVQLNYYIDSS